MAPELVRPYPSKGDQIADRPNSDGGGNLGRLARAGLALGGTMDEIIEETLALHLAGIPVKDWKDFLRKFEQ